MAITHTGGSRRFRLRPRRHGLRYLLLATAVIAGIAFTAVVLGRSTTPSESAAAPASEEHQPFDPRYATPSPAIASGVDPVEEELWFRLQNRPQVNALATPARPSDIWDFKERMLAPPDVAASAPMADLDD